MSPNRILSQRSLDLLVRDLQERRHAAVAISESLQNEALEIQVTVDRSDFLDSDTPMGTASEVSYSLAAGAHDSVRRIDRALGRISSGVYGNCELCGDVISFERLRALPTATLCLDCMAAIRRTETGHVRAYEWTLT